MPTLYDQIWNDHVVDETPDGTCFLYVDRHILDEVDSPQAFGALRLSGRPGRAPEKTQLVVDPNVSMHEAKAFACQVYPGRRPGAAPKPTKSPAPWPTRAPVPDTPAAAQPEGRFGHDD